MNAHENAVKTGTSTVGITFKGGVVVGADHRALWVISSQIKASRNCSRLEIILH